jgi:hypothetical protein
MKRSPTRSKLHLALQITLLAGLLLVGLALPRTASAALYWYQCNSPATMHVAAFSNRVHVWCQSTTPVAAAPTLAGISWFAFPTSPDAAAASRMLSLMQVSAVSGRTIWMELNPDDTSGSSFGCAPSDSRRIVALEMR